MKAVKRLLTLALALCMLIGIPFAVSAADEFTIERVVEAPLDLDLSQVTLGNYDKTQVSIWWGHIVEVHFSSEPSDATVAAFKARSINTRIRVYAPNSNTPADNMSAFYVGSLTDQPTVHLFAFNGNDGNKTFDIMRTTEGYTYSKSIDRACIAFQDTTDADGNGCIDQVVDKAGNQLALRTSEEINMETRTTVPLVCEAMFPLPDARVVKTEDKERIWLLSFNQNVGAYDGTTIKMAAYGADGSVISDNITCYVASEYTGGRVLAVRVANTQRTISAINAMAQEKGTTVSYYQIDLFDNKWPSNFHVDTLYNEAGSTLAYTTEKRDSAFDCVRISYYPNNDVASIGNVKYTSLENALQAATTNDTVKLLADVTESDAVLILNTGVTLDLNSHYLTANSLLAFGDVIDSYDGYGKLVVGADKVFNLTADGGILHLYDTDGYRFFKYEFHHIEKETGNADTVQYSVGLGFTNKDAYALLLADDVDFGVKMIITKADGSVQGIEWIFSDTLMAEFAAKNATKRTAITVTISGITNLNGAPFTSQAILATSNVKLAKDMVAEQ